LNRHMWTIRTSRNLFPSWFIRYKRRNWNIPWKSWKYWSFFWFYLSSSWFSSW